MDMAPMLSQADFNALLGTEAVKTGIAAAAKGWLLESVTTLEYNSSLL